MPKHKLRISRKRVIYPLLALIVSLSVAIGYFVVNDEPVPFIGGEAGVAPEILGGVDREGKGGDRLLNRQKNRISLPSTIGEYTVPQIIGIQHDVLSQEGSSRPRNKWYPSAKLFAEEKEAMGVSVTGYLLRTKQAGNEAANGYIDSLRSYLLWIADKPTAERRTTMMAEITPRWKAINPTWKLRTFKRLAEQKAKVRVSGWLLWDPEQGGDERTRGTSWEVHPVTKFEVWMDDKWVELQYLPEVDEVPVLPETKLGD